MNRLLSTTLVSAFLAATTASMAIAQTAPNANAPSASSPAHRFIDRPFSRPTERVEARLAYVKTALKITDAQQSQWDAYANFARKNAQDMEQRFKSMRSDKQEHPKHQRPNAIERLERAQSFLADAVTRINQLLAVEKPLYAALSPEQQKAADVVLNPRLRSMERRLMHGRGGFNRG
jgi:periplasmic protein CpxP/Spy